MTNEDAGLAALADATRREIVECVAAAPHAVGELADRFPISRPAVSQHLRVLKEAGLVVDERAGRRRLYSLDPDAVVALRDYFDRLLGPPTSVRESIVVEAPVERAFATLTDDIGDWWPSDRHILRTRIAEMVFEPRVGGRIYERGIDGSIGRWARILVFDRHSRVVFSWDIDTGWRLEQDPARTSEVELRFVEEAPERTRIELEHRHLDRHGKGWEQMRDALGSAGGWQYGLSALAACCCV
jgi:DNA-binding transcriptional ArsR family regulator